MAKTKKKKNYRLRKSVRRTLGALFMISAIIIAAIPFPDAAATNGSGTNTEQGGEGGAGTGGTPTPKPSLDPIDALVYDVNDGGEINGKPSDYDTNINKDIDLNGDDTASGDVKTAYTLRLTEEGVWRYEEHFKYYLITTSSNTGEQNKNKEAILYKYNNDYTKKDITLASTINSGSYVSVLGNDYLDYFDEENSDSNIIVHELTLEELEKGDSNADCKLFKKYFIEQFEYLQGYDTRYAEYERKLEEYTKKYQDYVDGKISEEPEKPTAPDKFVKGDPREHLADSLKGEYFCEYVINSKYLQDKKTSNGTISDDYGTYKDIDLKGKGFQMVSVENPLAGASGTPIIYVAKAINIENAKNDAGLRIDDNGFLYTSLKSDAYTLRGIAEHAFSGVTSYMTLKLPESIKYIGDEAFMGSSVGEITIINVSQIGNRAFMGSQLNTITMNSQTKEIGTEAFRNTHLKSIDLPFSLTKIGKGAFAYNESLETIIINNTNTDLEIDDFAFYECKKLSSQKLTDKKISKIGKGAFAIETKDDGNCTRFELPNSLTKGYDDKDNKGIDGYILANRQSLKQVVMPDLLGLNTPTTLPSSIFKGCNNLEYVVFPDSCGYVKFDPNMFMDVTNADFYVQGPELDKQNKEASPRVSTWSCIMNYASDTDYRYVPYVYYINGQKYYEICKNNYRLLVDPQGVLISCELINKTLPLDEFFSIPPTVGNITVTGIGKDCFDETFINKIQNLRIEDGGAIKEIANNAFENASIMKTVYLGDSVEILGNEAFRNCKDLTEVTFGKNINRIGERAFQGCYSLQKVIFEKPDNVSNLPISNIGNGAFDTYYYNEDNKTETSAEKLIFEGVVDPSYGPFAWAMDPGNYVDSNRGIRVCYETGKPYMQRIILDNRNNSPTLIDYLQFEDLNSIKTRDKKGNEVTVMQKLNDRSNPDMEYTLMDEAIIKAVSRLEIPKGVESIDVKGFIDDESNKNNVVRYLSDDSNFAEYMAHGLFNGECADGNDVSAVKSIGNDRLEEVIMHSVKYLPNEYEITDYWGRGRSAGDIIATNGLSGGAFYSCENLTNIQLGEIEDIGQLPFEGCYKLNSVGFGSENAGNTTDYECERGIIYKKAGDNNYEIIQCLGSRGNSKLPEDYIVSVDYDSKLANVSEIAIGAFSDCPYLRKVDFEGNTLLKKIPDKCFLGDEPLPGESNYGMGTIILPEQTRTIGHYAMAHCDNIDLTIKGVEVTLPSDAFDGTNRVKVRAKKDTAAYNTVEDMKLEVDPLPEGEVLYKVQFYDYDFKTTIGPEQKIKYGEYAVEPAQPTREGYKFVGWSTYDWSQEKGNGVTKDLDVIAMYETDTTSTGGNNNNNNNNNNGNNNGNNNNNGTTGGTQVNGGIDTNGDGIPDVDKDGNKLYKLTVTNGEGGGYYKAGQTVTIKAGNAPKGTGFAFWSCSNESLIFEDYTDWITTLTMINSDVTVICNFRGYYTLEVEYGSGSGSYPAGAKVAVSAVEAPQGRKFASWVVKEGQPTVEDSKKATTTITMPTGNAKISATYMDTGKTSVSGNSTSSSKNNTSVIITKPGISDKDKASAYVSGSSDNFIVKISESLDAADEVQRALQKKYSDMSRIKYFAMDISLYDAKGENKITNTDGLKVNITMPIPDALKEYAGNNRVGAVVNGELESINPKFTTIDGIPSITFTATHFSPYTIYVDTGNMTVSNTLDSTPKTGDIHPKWFLSLGLACISIILFTKRDRRYTIKA